MSTQQGEEHGKHPRPRLETLSDLIFGLSLSIGAISLVITNNQRSAPGDINRNILEFLFVFLILITSWIIYTPGLRVDPVRYRLRRHSPNTGWIRPHNLSRGEAARRRRPNGKVTKNTEQVNTPDHHSALLPSRPMELAPLRNTGQALHLVCTYHLILAEPYEEQALRSSAHFEDPVESTRLNLQEG